MKILITGNLGYVGSTLSRFLVNNFYNLEIIGFDTAYFAHSLTESDFLPEQVISKQYFGDIRDINPTILNGVDSIIHLAGISNDPIGYEFEDVTRDINRIASVRLAKISSVAGVKNFVFASSCSMYGQAEGGSRKETDPTNPLTAYAKSKIGTEDDLKNTDLGEMVITSLRFATACGWSPRLRLDLVLNDFVACAITSGTISILSDGTPWRPLIDVEDMSRAISWAMTREKKKGGQFLAINVGKNENNYQVKDIAMVVSSMIPNSDFTISKDGLSDKRSYSVDFSLYESLAPGYQPEVPLERSICRIRDGLKKIKFEDNNFRQSTYMRLNTIRKHIKENRLDSDLRWKKF